MVGATDCFFRPCRDSSLLCHGRPALKRWAIANLVCAAESLGRCVAPGDSESFAGPFDLRVRKVDARVLTSTPCAFDRQKHIRIGSDKTLLFLGCQFHHRPIFVGLTERGEDFVADTKIRMIHVRGFNCFRKTQGDLPKIICGHANQAIDLRKFRNST